MKIAVAGTGYVGLSIAVLLAQHHEVTAVDIIQEKVDLINNRRSPMRCLYASGHAFVRRSSLRISKRCPPRRCGSVCRRRSYPS